MASLSGPVAAGLAMTGRAFGYQDALVVENVLLVVFTQQPCTRIEILFATRIFLVFRGSAFQIVLGLC